MVTKASFVSLLVSRRRQRAASLYDTRQHPRSLRLEASLRYRRLETRRNLAIDLYFSSILFVPRHTGSMLGMLGMSSSLRVKKETDISIFQFNNRSRVNRGSNYHSLNGRQILNYNQGHREGGRKLGHQSKFCFSAGGV